MVKNYALVKGDVVQNVIVVDDPDWLTEHVEEMGYDRAVDTATINGPVAPGFIFKQGSGYLPPCTLTSPVGHIPPDGTTSATITYTDNRPNAPTSVVATVNGQPLTVTLSSGAGSFDVTSRTPGDTVTIAVEGASLVITVDAS